MVKSIVIICNQSPIGKNSAEESIRIATGLISLGDIKCQTIFTDDAVYFFSKKLNPGAVNMDSNASILRLMKLTDLEVNILEESLIQRGLSRSDLIDYENLNIIDKKELAEAFLNADTCFRY